MYTKCFGILLDLEDTHEPPPSFDENGFDSRESENEFKLATLIGQDLSIVQEPWDKFQTYFLLTRLTVEVAHMHRLANMYRFHSQCTLRFYRY